MECLRNDDIGRGVRVVSPGNYTRTKYQKRIVGKTGVIMAIYDGSAAVEVSGEYNERSKNGFFYLRACEIEFYEGATEMKAKIEGYLNVAMVQFLNDSRDLPAVYEYANFDPDLSVGDVCVVMSASHGMGLAKVVDFKTSASVDLYREIVCRVNTSEYDTRVAKREEAAELRKKMAARAKTLQDIVLYQTLAASDPEMAALMKQFEAITK